MRALFVTSSYPRFETDSASIFLRHLAEALAQLGVEVTVLAPADCTQHAAPCSAVRLVHFNYLPRRWQRLAYGSGVLPNLKQQPLLWLQVPAFLTGMAAGLRRAVRSVGADVIHAHWIVPAGLVSVLYAACRPIPVITTGHGADAFALNSPLLRRLKRYIVGRSTCWTTNTGATAEAVDNAHLGMNWKIIPMGVDTKHFGSGDAVSLRKDLDPHTAVILFVGRLVEKKGVTYLLRALAQSAPSLCEKVKLWIVGDGDERARLESESRALGLQDVVRFWGRIDNQRLPDFYAAADVFVGPSVEAESGDAEGQGVVFIEAFSAGVAAIGTRVGGIPEVIEHHRNGLLVEPKSAEQLQQAIDSLLADRDLAKRLGERARRDAKLKYDWPVVAAQFKSTYEDAVATQPTRRRTGTA